MNPIPLKNRKSPQPLLIEQAGDGYRYSIEPFLIADFTNLFAGDRVLDVGTGCGIIPILLMMREPELKITAIEIQTSLFDLACANIEKNSLSDRIHTMAGDFIELAPSLGSQTFDLVVSNPPYRKIQTGRTNPNQEKAIARHEIKLSLQTLVKNSEPLLKTGGRIVLAYPPQRLPEVLQVLQSQELYPSRSRFIHGVEGTEAKIFLIEAVKGRKEEMVVLPPLYVYAKNK